MLDFEDYSFTQPAFLVTIITEAVIKDSVITLLKNLRVVNYTVSTVQGEGRHLRFLAATETQPGTQVANLVETPVEIRTLVSQELSNVILHTLKEQRGKFAIIAYRQPVEALAEDL